LPKLPENMSRLLIAKMKNLMKMTRKYKRKLIDSQKSKKLWIVKKKKRSRMRKNYEMQKTLLEMI
jgi:hypothetical protein